MNLKKSISAAAALILAAGMSTGFLGSSVQTISARDYSHTGDVNIDGKVNVTDIIKVAAHIKGEKILKGNAYKNADVNCDGIVSIKDFTLLAAYVKSGTRSIPGKKTIVEEPIEIDEITGDAEDGCDETLS